MIETRKLPGCAIVTGGARGLGEAMVLELASEGYAVVINSVTDKRAGKAAALAKRVREEFGVGAVTVQADVASYEDCQRIVETGCRAFGDQVGVLVNNAGIMTGKLFHEHSPDGEYTRLISIELLGSMHLTHCVLPHMQPYRSGCIVCISSVAAHMCMRLQADYSEAKAGLIAFMRVIARENAPYNIRANTIAPGLCVTDMMRDQPKERTDAVRQAVPLGFLGEPKDISDCLAYIVNSKYLTGQCISPNGGYAMYL